MKGKDVIFLIEYDRDKGRVLKLEKFSGTERRCAEEARLNLELDLRSKGLSHEVVLLEATNEDSVRRTHRRYFENLQELAVPMPS